LIMEPSYCLFPDCALSHLPLFMGSITVSSKLKLVAVIRIS
jgi:hypothetical protein